MLFNTLGLFFLHLGWLGNKVNMIPLSRDDLFVQKMS